MRQIQKLGRLVLVLLRELADENAYYRHLEMYGLTHSEAAWRAFADERAKLRYSRPKCC